MSDFETVRTDLEGATDALEDLRTSIREGDDVDLDAFNLMVARTCRAAVDLPKADAIRIRPQLERLLGKLNEARGEIEAEQGRVDARLAQVQGTVSARGALISPAGDGPEGSR